MRSRSTGSSFRPGVLKALILLGSVMIGCGGSGGGDNSGDGGRPRNGDASVGPIPGGDVEIPTAHPRLWWNDARMSAAESWFASHPFTPGTVNDADSAADAALHYLLTDNMASARSAITWALAVRVNTSGHGSDIARWDGEGVILVFDWCHDAFTPAERTELITRWNTYIDELNQQDWGGVGMEGNNYYLGNVRNVIEWAIATAGENDRAEEFLMYGLQTRWAESYIPYANTAGKGGLMHEGSAYGRRVLYYLTVPLVTAELLGRNMWDETPFFRESIYWLIYSTTPGTTQQPSGNGIANIYETWPSNEDERWADRSVPGNTSQTGLGEYLVPLVTHYAALPIAGYAQQFIDLTDADPQTRFIEAVATPVTPRSFESLPLDYYADGMGMGYAKTAWNGNATAFNVQVSTPLGVGHNHFDAGTFQLWRHGRWVSRETVGYGEEVAGYANNGTRNCGDTVGHNGLLYNGRGSIAWQDSRPTTTRLASEEDYYYVAMDLTGAYTIREDQAHRENEVSEGQTLGNPGANRTIREMIFVRPLETLVIFDRMEAGGPSPATVTKTFLVHFENAPTLNGDSYVGVTGDQALRVTTVIPSSVTRRVVTEGGGIGQYRAEIETTGATQSYFLNVLQSRDATGANLAIDVNDTGTGYELTITHPTLGRAVIVFERGATSTGGAFGFATSGTPTTSPLRAGVQSISMDYDGVWWGE